MEHLLFMTQFISIILFSRCIVISVIFVCFHVNKVNYCSSRLFMTSSWFFGFLFCICSPITEFLLLQPSLLLSLISTKETGALQVSNNGNVKHKLLKADPFRSLRSKEASIVDSLLQYVKRSKDLIERYNLYWILVFMSHNKYSFTVFISEEWIDVESSYTSWSHVNGVTLEMARSLHTRLRDEK